MRMDFLSTLHPWPWRLHEPDQFPWRLQILDANDAVLVEVERHSYSTQAKSLDDVYACVGIPRDRESAAAESNDIQRATMQALAATWKLLQAIERVLNEGASTPTIEGLENAYRHALAREVVVEADGRYVGTLWGAGWDAEQVVAAFFESADTSYDGSLDITTHPVSLVTPPLGNHPPHCVEWAERASCPVCGEMDAANPGDCLNCANSRKELGSTLSALYAEAAQHMSFPLLLARGVEYAQTRVDTPDGEAVLRDALGKLYRYVCDHGSFRSEELLGKVQHVLGVVTA